MIHTYLPRNSVVFLLLCELTWRSVIYGSQKFDFHKWPTVFVDEVKRKLCNLEVCLCGSLYSTWKKSFQPYAFHTKITKAFQRPTRTRPRQRVPLYHLHPKTIMNNPMKQKTTRMYVSEHTININIAGSLHAFHCQHLALCGMNSKHRGRAWKKVIIC